MIDVFTGVDFWFGLTTGALISDVAKKAVKQRFKAATGATDSSDENDG